MITQRERRMRLVAETGNPDHDRPSGQRQPRALLPRLRNIAEFEERSAGTSKTFPPRRALLRISRRAENIRLRNSRICA